MGGHQAALSNWPGSRISAALWHDTALPDSTRTVWLFGGYGMSGDGARSPGNPKSTYQPGWFCTSRCNLTWSVRVRAGLLGELSDLWSFGPECLLDRAIPEALEVHQVPQ